MEVFVFYLGLFEFRCNPKNAEDVISRITIKIKKVTTAKPMVKFVHGINEDGYHFMILSFV